MRQLHFDLLRLLDDDRRGSQASRRARRHVLAQAAETLHGLGYRGLKAWGFKGRHVEAPVKEWRRQGLSDGTVRNRLARAVARPEDRQAGHRGQGQHELRDRSAVRDLNWDLLQLQRRIPRSPAHAPLRGHHAGCRGRISGDHPPGRAAAANPSLHRSILATEYHTKHEELNRLIVKARGFRSELRTAASELDEAMKGLPSTKPNPLGVVKPIAMLPTVKEINALIGNLRVRHVALEKLKRRLVNAGFPLFQVDGDTGEITRSSS